MNAKKMLVIGMFVVAMVATGCAQIEGYQVTAPDGAVYKVVQVSGAVTPTIMAPSATDMPTETATVTPTATVTTTANETATVTSTTMATLAATVAPSATITLTLGVESREERLERLTQVFKTDGLEPMLKEAGFAWSSLRVEARQIEEEVNVDEILASGVQVEVTGLTAPWPSGFTTDREVVTGRGYQPDLRNPSKIWTDVVGYTGPATLWLDLSDWGQLAPVTPTP